MLQEQSSSILMSKLDIRIELDCSCNVGLKMAIKPKHVAYKNCKGVTY